MDRRTMPRWLMWPALVSLVALSCYNLGAFHFALKRDQQAWTWYWGTWQMFTTLDTTASVVEAEVQEASGEWTPLDLQTLFPYRWESGPRYARSAFFRDPSRMAVLGASVCNRIDRPIQGVRAYEVRWVKVVGSLEHKRERKSQRLDWRCGRKIGLPGGRILE